MMSWCLAGIFAKKTTKNQDDEDEDDDHQHDGQILLLLLLIVSRRRHSNSSHFPPLFSLLIQCLDQLSVEERQKEQRTSQHHDEVEDAVVDYAEGAAFSDRGEVMYRHVVVGWKAEDPVVLEKSRDVVNDSGGGHVADVALTARQRAQSGRAVRLADSYVAVERNENGQQDGSRQRHEVQWPQVRHGCHIEASECAEKVGVYGNTFYGVQRE